MIKSIPKKIIILTIIFLLFIPIISLDAGEKCVDALNTCMAWAFRPSDTVFCLTGYVWCEMFIGK